MNEEIYKSTLQQINLSMVQKEKMLVNIEAAYEKSHSHNAVSFPIKRKFSRCAAAFLCVLLLSNLTVYAAKKLNLAAYFQQFYSNIAMTNVALDNTQQALIDNYGTELNQSIILPHGTLTINGALYDSHMIYLTYTYESTKHIYCAPSLDVSINGFQATSMMHGSQTHTYKEGYVTGYYILFSNDLEKDSFHENDLIELSHPSGDCPVSFSLTDSLNSISQNMVDTNTPVVVDDNILINQVIITPLSVTIQASATGSDLDHAYHSIAIRSITVTKKDGSTVPLGNVISGSGGHYSDSTQSTNLESHGFETPCAPSDIAYVTLELPEHEIQIPVSLE